MGSEDDSSGTPINNNLTLSRGGERGQFLAWVRFCRDKHGAMNSRGRESIRVGSVGFIESYFTEDSIEVRSCKSQDIKTPRVSTLPSSSSPKP